MDEQATQTPEERKNSPFLPILGGIVLLALLGGVFVLNKGQSAQSPTSTSTVGKMDMSSTPKTQTSVSPSSSASNAAVMDAQSVTVEGGNFYFKPNEIRVKKGQKVTINFSNAGGMHDFVINEFNVRTDRIGGGQTTTVSFTPDKTGTFEFYCSVGNHRQMGMKGNLIVE